MKTYRVLSIGLAGVCLLMTSCIDSISPLSNPEKAKADPALLGVWRATKEGGNVDYCHIGRIDGKLPPGVLWAITTTHYEHGSVTRPGEMPVFTTEIGKTRFLNVAVPIANREDLDKLQKSGWNSDLVGGYWFAMYEVRGDTLTVWTLDAVAKRQAIQSGKIKGVMKDEGVAYFTDTPKKIAAMLTAPENADLFVKTPIQYQRVK